MQRVKCFPVRVRVRVSVTATMAMAVAAHKYNIWRLLTSFRYIYIYTMYNVRICIRSECHSTIPTPIWCADADVRV